MFRRCCSEAREDSAVSCLRTSLPQRSSAILVRDVKYRGVSRELGFEGITITADAHCFFATRRPILAFNVFLNIWIGSAGAAPKHLLLQLTEVPTRRSAQALPWWRLSRCPRLGNRGRDIVMIVMDGLGLFSMVSLLLPPPSFFKWRVETSYLYKDKGFSNNTLWHVYRRQNGVVILRLLIVACQSTHEKLGRYQELLSTRRLQNRI